MGLLVVSKQVIPIFCEKCFPLLIPYFTIICKAINKYGSDIFGEGKVGISWDICTPQWNQEFQEMDSSKKQAVSKFGEKFPLMHVKAINSSYQMRHQLLLQNYGWEVQ